ncbi:hypothetical protein GN956_G25788 [Arapaima gigas]
MKAASGPPQMGALRTLTGTRDSTTSSALKPRNPREALSSRGSYPVQSDLSAIVVQSKCLQYWVTKAVHTRFSRAVKMLLRSALDFAPPCGRR